MMSEYALIDTMGGSRADVSRQPGNYADGFEPSRLSVAEFDPNNRQGLCIAKDHTCKGHQVKGSKYCQGHKRSVEAQRQGVLNRRAATLNEREREQWLERAVEGTKL